MKRLVLLALVLAAAIPAQAQLFGGPNSVGGAVLGGIAGGIIGHNNGRHTAEGVAIGAGAGLLLGAIADRNNADRAHYGYSSRSYGPSYSVGFSYGHAPYRHGYHHNHWGHGHWGHRHYGHYGHYPSYGFRVYSSPRYVYTPTYVAPAPVVVAPAAAPVTYVSPSSRYGYTGSESYAAPQTQASQAPSQVTIINNYYGNTSPMSGANGLFGR